MFAILIICAWSLTLTAAAGLLMFGSASVFMIVVASSKNQAAIGQALQSPLGQIWDKISVVFKGVSPIYGPTNLNNKVALGSGNSLAIMIWTIVIFAVAITLIVISILELVRLRKHQKLSKPFVKVTMVITAIMLLLTFQMILVIVSSLILVAFVLLEAVLFDSEALNNYAEERNLISIYKEERKFEKEVSKEGKLTGNVDLKNQQEDFQKENDQTKVNDNSALPNLTEEQLENIYKEDKAKKYYLKWKTYKAKLNLQRKEIEAKIPTLGEKEIAKIISKFNFNVMKVNLLAKKLKIPESYYVSYMTIENQEGGNSMDTNFKSNSITEATTAFGGEESTSVDEDIESLHDRYSGGNKPGVPQTFVAPQTIVHGTKPKNKGLEEEFLKAKMARAVNMTIEQLPEVNLPADADRETIYADLNFDQPDLAGQVMMKDMKKAQAKKEAIANAAPGTTVSAPPTFTFVPPTENLLVQEPEKQPEVLGTFVAPQTVVHGTKKPEPGGLEEEFLKAKMARAVNMTIEQLPEVNLPADADRETIYADLNFDQPDLAGQVMMKDMKKAQAKKEAIAKGAPGTTVSTLPVFHTNMVLDFNQEELDEEREARRNEFIAPQTVVHGTKKPEPGGLEEEFLKAKMARAVNMDLNQLAESERPDADKDSIYADFNFDQPDLAGQVMMKDMKKAQEKQAAIANAAPGTTVSAPPSFDANLMGADEIVENPVSFAPEVDYEEEFGLSGSNSPMFGGVPSTPKIEEDSFNMNNVKIESNVPESFDNEDEDHSFESYDDAYQREQEKKEIIQKEEELLNRFEANINAIDLEKLNSIEERMAKLENLIESLGNKLGGDQLSQDFTKITNQLDSISKVVNELESNSPRTIIDSLTTRHNYNKNNG